MDGQGKVWLSDFGANALVRFDPGEEAFRVFLLPSSPANIRQILGRPGEVWGAESGVDRLVVVRAPVSFLPAHRPVAGGRVLAGPLLQPVGLASHQFHAAPV